MIRNTDGWQNNTLKLRQLKELFQLFCDTQSSVAALISAEKTGEVRFTGRELN